MIWLKTKLFVESDSCKDAFQKSGSHENRIFMTMLNRLSQLAFGEKGTFFHWESNFMF